MERNVVIDVVDISYHFHTVKALTITAAIIWNVQYGKACMGTGDQDPSCLPKLPEVPHMFTVF